jgi:hypothetical protein
VRERDLAWIVLQCEAITDIDITAAEMLEQLDNELNAAGIHLAFAELRGRRDSTAARPHGDAVGADRGSRVHEDAAFSVVDRDCSGSSSNACERQSSRAAISALPQPRERPSCARRLIVPHPT